MKIRQLKDKRWQVMRDDGASLALTGRQWLSALLSAIKQKVT